MSAVRTGPGRHVYYDDLGTGAPVLVIPGAMTARRGWMAPLVTSLATHHRVIPIDLRDAGESAPETGIYTVADLAGDAIAVLDALAIEHAHIVGYSLGGAVAQQVVISYPDRVLSLVSIGSYSHSTKAPRPGDPFPPPEEWWSADPIERARLNIPYILGPRARESLDEATLIALGESDRDNHITWDGIMRQTSAVFGFDLRSQLRQVRVPVLVMHGEVDPIVPLDRGILTAESIPTAELLILPGVGHMPWIDEPEVVPRAIQEFVANADSATSSR